MISAMIVIMSVTPGISVGPHSCAPGISVVPLVDAGGVLVMPGISVGPAKAVCEPMPMTAASMTTEINLLISTIPLKLVVKFSSGLSYKPTLLFRTAAINKRRARCSRHTRNTHERPCLQALHACSLFREQAARVTGFLLTNYRVMRLTMQLTRLLLVG